MGRIQFCLPKSPTSKTDGGVFKRKSDENTRIMLFTTYKNTKTKTGESGPEYALLASGRWLHCTESVVSYGKTLITSIKHENILQATHLDLNANAQTSHEAKYESYSLRYSSVSAAAHRSTANSVQARLPVRNKDNYPLCYVFSTCHAGRRVFHDQAVMV